MDDKLKAILDTHYDDFLAYYYCTPCAGCNDGHPSFWKTIIESQEWKNWKKDNDNWDWSENEELGILSDNHWNAFIKLLKKQQKINDK